MGNRAKDPRAQLRPQPAQPSRIGGLAAAAGQALGGTPKPAPQPAPAQPVAQAPQAQVQQQPMQQLGQVQQPNPDQLQSRQRLIQQPAINRPLPARPPQGLIDRFRSQPPQGASRGKQPYKRPDVGGLAGRLQGGPVKAPQQENQMGRLGAELGSKFGARPPQGMQRGKRPYQRPQGPDNNRLQSSRDILSRYWR